jgi:DNA helicase-2/ATP-dependent DNA helicase PcrA
MQRGEVQYNRVSRFVKEIPIHLLDSTTAKNKSISRKDSESKNTFSKPNPYQAAKKVEQTRPYQFMFDKLHQNSAKQGDKQIGEKRMSAAELFESGLVKKGFGNAEKGSNNADLSSKTGSDTGGGAYGIGYDVGDTVRHIKFGTGTVLSITDAGRDYEVSVNFQNAGVRKLMASFAKLKKTN